MEDAKDGMIMTSRDNCIKMTKFDGGGGGFMDALISIKPCFVEKILDLSKRYEYRKRLFSQEIDRVYIYASAPIKKIVGYFPYNEVVSGDLDKVWKITADYSGISREYYDKYFDNKEKY